ncbi:enamine deaminase RidA [Labrys miyagiensis]|uniref:Enamine deaminase RidA n=1 Tax=Labrys miyagiensis TaxID=346912 RepID=A0ABQ6CS49_9HYPH|nr:RidA family protein [Labrys miyagiensis]GLS22635.1 enamine deaminase RidA [Labrys miyagiensis]
MQMIVRNPIEGIYAATPDYVHAMEVVGAQRLLFISGTMGLDAAGRPPERLEAQLTLIWSNLRRILAEAGMTIANVVRVTSYLREVAFAEANQQARLDALGDHRIPTTAIVVATLSPDWLVEVEAVAAG